MNERRALIGKLQEKYEGREDEAEKLDDLVIDAKCRSASAVNNGGIYEQIEYLIESGYSEKEITDALDGNV